MMETKEVPFCSDKGDGFGAKKRARFVLEERGEIARSDFGFKARELKFTFVFEIILILGFLSYRRVHRVIFERRGLRIFFEEC